MTCVGVKLTKPVIGFVVGTLHLLSSSALWPTTALLLAFGDRQRTTWAPIRGAFHGLRLIDKSALKRPSKSSSAPVRLDPSQVPHRHHTTKESS